MRQLLVFFVIFCSTNAIANIDLNIELNVNGKILNLENKNLEFDKEAIVKSEGVEVAYKVSNNFPKEAIIDQNKNKSVFILITAKDAENILSNAKVITVYDQKATVETTYKKGYFKLALTPSETKEENENRISNIKRLPVLTESTFLVNYQPAEMIKTELEKILTTKGSIKINKKTNSLIVKDVLENIVLINQKFNSIDI